MICISGEDIKILEKPESISYDEIHELLWRANENNRKKGFVLATSLLKGDNLKARIGNSGKCFVAIYNNILVGTLSIRFVERKTWYAKETLADYILAGVLPQYTGLGVLSKLSKCVFDYAMANKCNMIELDTAEANKKAIDIYKHYGFKLVDFRANRGGDHYSVIMVKWFNKCPYSGFYIILRYNLRRLYIKMRFKPDNSKRFGV